MAQGELLVVLVNLRYDKSQRPELSGQMRLNADEQYGYTSVAGHVRLTN